MQKKILILTASYWAWHNVAANTMKNYYTEKWYQVHTIDLVEFLSSLWKWTQSFYQDFCSKYPNAWDITYNILDKDFIKKILFWVEYPFSQKKFDNIVSDLKPDIILSVFPFWWGFIKNNIKNYKKTYKTWVVITDAISIHNIWHLKGNIIDYYFVIDDLTKEIFLKKFQHKKDNVITSFFPIEEKYFLDKQTIDNKNIYLLLSWLKFEFTNNLLSLLQNTDFKINIIKWRNKIDFELLKYMYNTSSNFNFIDFINLKDSYKDIDIFIWKAWWATFSECIATNTPIIVPDFIPWQEEWNLELLKQSNTWIYETNPEKIVFLLKYLNWNLLIDNFNKIKKQNSCDIIYEILKNLTCKS